MRTLLFFFLAGLLLFSKSFGQTNPSDEEVQGIVARVLSNQDEVKRLSDQVVAEKLLELFKEKANPTTKEVTYEEFIAASYGE